MWLHVVIVSQGYQQELYPARCYIRARKRRQPLPRHPERAEGVVKDPGAIRNLYLHYKKKALKTFKAFFIVVAGEGFEPTTFRL